MSSNLPLKKNFGSEVAQAMPQLSRQLDEMYTDIANALNLLVKKNILNGADPAANDQRNSFFSIGDVAVRTDTDTAWIMTSRTTPNAVTWTQIT
ncbi:MAG: hypothetical protein ACH349_01440 [Candidatus Rhabdochlamydia sp.]